MKNPMMLPWIARQAGISAERVNTLWLETLNDPNVANLTPNTSEYWKAAEAQLRNLVEREKSDFALPTPQFSWIVRFQMRTVHWPVLTLQSWSLAWMRSLAVK